MRKDQEYYTNVLIWSSNITEDKCRRNTFIRTFITASLPPRVYIQLVSVESHSNRFKPVLDLREFDLFKEFQFWLN